MITLKVLKSPVINPGIDFRRPLLLLTNTYTGERAAFSPDRAWCDKFGISKNATLCGKGLDAAGIVTGAKFDVISKKHKEYRKRRGEE